MFETYFGFKKVPFSDERDAKQLFEHAGWKQASGVGSDRTDNLRKCSQARLRDPRASR